MAERGVDSRTCNYGLLAHRAELVKTLETGNGRFELRAVTKPDYDRIWDHELVAAVHENCRQWHRRYAMGGPRCDGLELAG